MVTLQQARDAFSSGVRAAAGLPRRAVNAVESSPYGQPGPEMKVEPLRPYEASPATGIMRAALSVMADARARANYKAGLERQQIRDDYMRAQTEQIQSKLATPKQAYYLDVNGERVGPFTDPSNYVMALKRMQEKPETTRYPYTTPVSGTKVPLTGNELAGREQADRNYERLLNSTSGGDAEGVLANRAAVAAQRALNNLRDRRAQAVAKLEAQFGMEEAQNLAQIERALLTTSGTRMESGGGKAKWKQPTAKTREGILEKAKDYGKTRLAAEKAKLIERDQAEEDRLNEIIQAATGKEVTPEWLTRFQDFLRQEEY